MCTSHNSSGNNEFSGRGLRIFGLAAIGAVLSVPHLLTAQHTRPTEQKEQSEFGIELEAVPIQRPVTLPRAALDALSKDHGVASCLENAGLRSHELPANWFVASEIHLDGPNEADLVVLPGGRVPGTPAGEISPNVCFFGANSGQMWILRKTQHSFKLVLSQYGLGLGVLATKTNGLRDVQVGAMGGGSGYSTDYKFDGESYKIAARESEEIGAEFPHTLTAFKNRKVLIQSPGQSAEAVRAQARAWLWQQWQAQQRSYLKIKTHDDSADETSSYFIAPDDKGNWEVTFQVRRIVWDDATASQHRITEKELSVASEVRRVEPATDDTHAPRAISEDETVPGSAYQLQFLDYANRDVATL